MLLEIEGLSITYHNGRRTIEAVSDLWLTMAAGESLAIVGESGSGKSSVASAVVGLTKPSAGRVRFLGQDLGKLHGGAQRAMRQQIGMVFQNPYTSLNPRMRIAATVAEALNLKRSGGRPVRADDSRVATYLEQVGLPAAFGQRFPHELSGGQRQRAAIARAIALRPRLLILDEPTAALDVSVQAQILNLLMELRAIGLTMLFISHNLATVPYIANRVAVMSHGRIIEEGPTATIFCWPTQDYTRRLLSAVPHFVV